MVRFLPPPGGAGARRRAALPPEALLLALLVTSPTPAGGADAPSAAEPKLGATITARPGDTLSSLAARHLGHAAAWRQVWALNRRLADPNVLEVGAEVRLPPVAGAGLLASNVDLPPAPRTPPPPPPPILPTLGHALWPKAQVARLGRLVAALGDSTLARRGERLSARAGADGGLRRGSRYVTLAEAGAVRGFGGAEGGEVLSVTGVVRAEGDGEATEVVLEHLYAEVEAGQRLAPLENFVVEATAASPRPAPPELVAQLLGVERDALAAGGGKLAFVGAGSRAGLAPGMRLWFVDDNEAARRPRGDAAASLAHMAALGELRVLAVQEHAATCAIVRSAREVGRGQLVRGANPGADAVDPSP